MAIITLIRQHEQQLQQSAAQVPGQPQQAKQSFRGIKSRARLRVPALLQPLQRLLPVEHLRALVHALPQHLGR